MDHAVYTQAILSALLVAVIVGGAGGVIALVLHILDPETRRARRVMRRRGRNYRSAR